MEGKFTLKFSKCSFAQQQIEYLGHVVSDQGMQHATLAAPFSWLLTKEGFAWTPEATVAFQNLKNVVTNFPVLALPDFTKPFVVETDASGSGMGVVLSQGRHPLAFFRK